MLRKGSADQFSAALRTNSRYAMKAAQRLGAHTHLVRRALCQHRQHRPLYALTGQIGPRQSLTPSSRVARFPRRHAGTKLRKSIEELPQGLQTPLEPFIEKEASKYSPVIDEVLQNQRRFPKCVLLTRVGQFYEVLKLFCLLIVAIFFSGR